MVLKYGRASAILSKRDADLVAKLCECGKAFLQLQATNLVHKYMDDPIALSYSSDSTPLTTTERFAIGRKELRVHRRGGSMHEYLVERLFVVAHTGEKAVLFKDPVRLADKATWCEFIVARQFFPIARELGHRGICVSHYSFDRATFSALDTKFKQLHRHVHAQLARALPAHEAALLELRDWYVSTPCGNHDAHNGLKWALHERMTDEAFIKDVHIVVESLRNSYDLLVDHLGKWIIASLSFEDWEFPHQRELWTALGLEPARVDEFVDLQLRFHEGRLKVAASRQDDPNLLESVSTCLLHAWRFRKFTTSRWITAGDTCKSMVLALLTGIESLVRMVRRNPKTSDYYIHGFGRLSEEMKTFMALTAMCSYVSDSFLVAMLEDDRVPVRLAALEEGLMEELEYVANLPMGVYSVVAEACGCSMGTLRSECIAAATISAGFITYKVLRVAHELPWSLCVGDVAKNLDELASGPEPRDATSAKLYRLVKLGHNRLQLVKGVQLMGSLSWSTTATEQGHGSTSALHKLHKQYGASTLTARAMVLMMRPLFTKVSHVAKAEQLRRRLEHLQQRKPRMCGGRQAYVQALFQVASAWRSKGRVMKGNYAHQIVRGHSRTWASMPDEQKRKFDTAAQRLVNAKRQALDEDIEVARSAIRLHATRIVEEEMEPEGKPLRVAACALDHQAVLAFDAFAESPQFTASHVDSLRARSLVAPEPPSPEMQASLASFGAGGRQRPSEPRPSWVSPLCRSRAFFKDAIFRWSGRGWARHLKFVYATQSPLNVCFCNVVLAATTFDDAPLSAHTWEAQPMAWSRHAFDVQWMSYVFSEELAFEDGAALDVLFDVAFMGGSKLASDAEWVSWENACRLLPLPVDEESKHEAAAPSGAPPSSVPEGGALLAKFPWLADFRKDTEVELARASKAESCKAKDVVEDPFAEESLEGDVADALEALYAKRCEWDLDGGDKSRDDAFVVKLLGGAWTKLHKGKDFDAFKGEARASASAWCKQYRLPQSARFEISLYGEYDASTLSAAWCHRMQHFYSRWLESGEDKYVFSADDALSYVEEPKFVDLCARAAGKALARCMQIRALLAGEA